MTPDSRSLLRRGEWHAQARAIKAADPELSNAEIGRRVGVSTAAVWKVLNPEQAKSIRQRDNHRPGRQDVKRAWDRANPQAHRNACVCGVDKFRTSTRCEGCLQATADVRRTLAEGMWADGWSLRDMAQAFEVKTAYFAGRRLRDGWDLPYRYQGTKRQREVAQPSPFYDLQEAA